MGLGTWALVGAVGIGAMGVVGASTASVDPATGQPVPQENPVASVAGDVAGDISRSFGEGVGQAAGGAVDESFGQLSLGTGAKVVGGGALLAGGAYGLGRGLQGIGQGVGQGVRDRIKNPRPPKLDEDSQLPTPPTTVEPAAPVLPDLEDSLIEPGELEGKQQPQWPQPPRDEPSTSPTVVIPAPPPVPAATPLLG